MTPKRKVAWRNSQQRYPSHGFTVSSWKRRLKLVARDLRPAVYSLVFWDHVDNRNVSPATQTGLAELIGDAIYDWRERSDPDTDRIEAALVQLGYEPEQARDRLLPYREGTTSERLTNRKRERIW